MTAFAAALLAMFALGGEAALAAAPADTLRLCDQAYAAGDVGAAVRLARRAAAAHPDTAAAAWRLSRALIAAANLEPDRGRRGALLSEARGQARRAIRADGTSAEGFTCLAVCQGSLSGLAGGRERIELAEEARTAALRALELDPDNALAHLVLGVWHREIAQVGGLTRLGAKLLYGGVPRGASLESSLAHLRRAIELAPRAVNPRRELGITLMTLKRYDEAATAFAAAAALPPSAPADSAYIADAAARLKEARRRAQEPPDFGLR